MNGHGPALNRCKRRTGVSPARAAATMDQATPRLTAWCTETHAAEIREFRQTKVDIFRLLQSRN